MPFPGLPLTRSRHVVGAAALAASCALALGACAVTQDDKEEPDASSSSPSATPDSPSATVTVTASPTPTPTPTPTPSPSTPAPTATSTTPEGALLTAAELPRLNETLRWRQGATGEATAEPFGLCQKVDLLSIGATSAVQRSFTARGGDLAEQQVAEFADAQTATRARKVVESWRTTCAKRVGVAGTKVTPLQPVTVASGTGWHYLVTVPRGDAGTFHALGMALSGTRMSLVQMVHAGQDHDYEPGQDPMELAVKAAAAKLGG